MHFSLKNQMSEGKHFAISEISIIYLLNSCGRLTGVRPPADSCYVSTVYFYRATTKAKAKRFNYLSESRYIVVVLEVMDG